MFSMPASDLMRLRHMLDAAREALAFVAGRKREDLLHDRVLTLALLRSIEIIGEAASKISPEMRAAHPDVPWGDIIGMRNRLIQKVFPIRDGYQGLPGVGFKAGGHPVVTLHRMPKALDKCRLTITFNQAERLDLDARAGAAGQ